MVFTRLIHRLTYKKRKQEKQLPVVIRTVKSDDDTYGNSSLSSLSDDRIYEYISSVESPLDPLDGLDVVWSKTHAPISKDDISMEETMEETLQIKEEEPEMNNFFCWGVCT
mmetsp:Transcript_346/g.470  ORF Transcript_346/g.470 Transcript_346/m.470 type:complete len:111 (+) Transcript_346:198-530(+)